MKKHTFGPFFIDMFPIKQFYNNCIIYLTLNVTHLHKDVPRYGEVSVFDCAELLDEFLCHGNAVLIQHESEYCSVS